MMKIRMTPADVRSMERACTDPKCSNYLWALREGQIALIRQSQNDNLVGMVVVRRGDDLFSAWGGELLWQDCFKTGDFKYNNFMVVIPKRILTTVTRNLRRDLFRTYMAAPPGQPHGRQDRLQFAEPEPDEPEPDVSSAVTRPPAAEYFRPLEFDDDE